MAVSYEELDGWPRSKWDQGDFDGERRILCAWSDRVSLLNELDVTPFWPTAYYPEGPADALIRSAQIFPFARMLGNTYAEYEWCVILARYSTRGPQWNAINKVFIEETLDPAGMSFSVDSENLRWVSDEEPVLANDAPTNHDYLVEYQVSFQNLNYVPAWIQTQPGLVNQNRFYTAGFDGIYFEPETLKYMGASVRGTYSLARLPRYSVTAKYMYKWSGWNTFWRSDTATWASIETTGNTPYIQHPLVTMNLI